MYASFYCRDTFNNQIDMDFLRELVGGPKNRFREHGYNLDLTYITERIVAMAFPASGIQKLYRNSVDSIKELLQTSHQNKYITVNISGRAIEEGKLMNVLNYEWQDHKAPPFDTLFLICQQVAAFLDQDDERIAVFHCNHGKGRTGTIICCMFLFLNAFKDTNDVMKFYAKRRFASDGYGVTQPCQIQYIRYFQTLLERPQLYPKIIRIKSVQLKGTFAFDQPYIKVYRLSGKDIAYNSKERGDKFEAVEDRLFLQVKQEVNLVGDITIDIKDNKTVGKNLLISYVFNTAFIDQNQTINVKLKDLSPLGKQKLPNFGHDFSIVIEIENVCQCAEKRILSGCNKCKAILKIENERWQNIGSTLKSRQNYLPRSDILCYGSSQF